MPIKIRCKECSVVLVVPDKAAGRAVKCKECGARINVPVPKQPGDAPAPAAAADGSAAPPKRKPRPQRPAPGPPANSDDLFGGLDLRRVEDSAQKICPACASNVDEEDIECPNCGVNIETGALSEQQRKRRARKGPPPEEFYKVIWSNGWKFTMAHKRFIVQTGIIWALSATMVILAAFVMKWYVTTRAEELIASAEGGVTISDTGVLIEPGEGEAKYDDVKYTSGSTLLTDGKLLLPTPTMAAFFSPPSYFWSFIFLIFVLSFGGWAWTLSAKVVEVTMHNEKKIKRFQTDMYGNMTKGFTTIFWPIVLMYPVIWIPLAMLAAGMSPNVSLITFLILFMIPYVIFLPIAVIHMAQPYTYRAWLINWMSKDLLSTFAPTAYVSALFFVLVLLIPLGAAVGIAVGWDQFSNFYMSRLEVPALGAMFGYTAEHANSTGSFIFYRMPFLFAVSFLTLTIFFMLLAIPSIFMMRVFGLFGLYFRPDLALCVEQVPLSPAGFGPRFLAIQVDAIVATVMCGAAFKGSGFVSGLVGMLYNSETARVIAYYATMIISTLTALGFYFANWESGSGRATLGKWTFGMIVLQDDNSPMPFKLALKRAAASVLSILSLGGTFIMCAFRSDHRAAHDLMTKTKVIWRGDENM